MCMAGFLFIAACTGSQTQQNPAKQGGPGPQDIKTTQTTGTAPIDGQTPPGTSTLTPEDQGAKAQELLRSGDVEGAITILEGMSATSPKFVGLNDTLIEAHMGYVREIISDRTVEPAVLNGVLYHHYMRILELDPANAEAAAGMNSVKQWYQAHSMTLPDKVDPLVFLPKEETAQDDDATRDSDDEEGESDDEEGEASENEENEEND